MNPAPPLLIVIFGLPGTGKTTLARELSGRLHRPHLNTDRIRSDLGKKARYKDTDKEFIYRELLNETGKLLESGQSTILDGTFYREGLRRMVEATAKRYHARVKWIEVRAAEEVVKQRVSEKREYSEADYAVYLKVRDEFELLAGAHLVLHSDSESLPQMIEKTVKYCSS